MNLGRGSCPSPGMDDFERQLADRLRGPRTEVPTDVDAAVLAAGHEAAGAFRRRRRLIVLRTAAAAAAVVTLLLWVGARSFDGDARGAGAARPLAGGFDVADAWRVARGLERDLQFDQNGDGRIDRSDADEMLRTIVALDARGS